MSENSQQHIKEEQDESKEIPDLEIQTKISLNPEILVTTNQRNNSTSPDVHSETISKSEADHDTGGGIATTFKDSTGAALTVGSSADCDTGGEVGDDVRNSADLGASAEAKGRAMAEAKERAMAETKMTNATPLDLIRDTSDDASVEDIEAVATANSGHVSTAVNGSLSAENGVEHEVFNVSSSGIDASGTGERRRRALRLVARPPKLLAAAFPWNSDDENQARKNHVRVEVTGVPLLAEETITAVMRLLTEEKVGAWDKEVASRRGGKMEGVAAVMFHFGKKRQRVHLLGYREQVFSHWVNPL